VKKQPLPRIRFPFPENATGGGVFYGREKRAAKKSGDFGADPDEQAINGDYGMLETEEEDKKD